jgi:hypothetical protein
MVDPGKQSNSKLNSAKYVTKKCPHCNAYMKLYAKACPECQRKVGPVDELGFAEKPVDWSGYLIAGILIVGFSLIMWWGFFRE